MLLQNGECEDSFYFGITESTNEILYLLDFFACKLPTECDYNEYCLFR